MYRRQIAFLPTLALLAAPVASTGAPHELRLDFDSPAAVRSLRFHDYAEEEGPLLMPGPWGDCADFSRSSRNGGGTQDKTPAGGAIFVPANRLPDQNDFTVLCAFRPVPAAPNVNARILNRKGSWELILSGNVLMFYVAAPDGRKTGHRFPGLSSLFPGWELCTAVVERQARRVRLYRSPLDSNAPPSEAVVAYPGIARSDRALEIGNYEGIRPFRGFLDNVRIFPAALSREQVIQLFRSLRDAAWTSAPDAGPAGLAPERTARRFRPAGNAVFFRALNQARLERGGGFGVLARYHATHLVWVYGENPAIVRRAHEMGLFYEGALNGMAGADKAGPDEPGKDGRQRDFDGRRFVLPHMQKWKQKNLPWTGCENSPVFRKTFFAMVQNLLDIGVDAIHVDDWEMTAATARGGLGCFCPYCIAGFRRFLGGRLSPDELRRLGIHDIRTFDYRRYLVEQCGIRNAEEYRRRFRTLPLTPFFLAFHRWSVRQFYQELRAYLDRQSPDRYIPVSVNNHFRSRGLNGALGGWYVADAVDFFIGEASKAMQHPEDYIMACKAADAFDIPQVMMYKPGSVAVGRAALATTYAMGHWFRVPWDVYMDNLPNGQPAPRYFGKEEDWKAPYDLIHDHPSLFNHTRTAGLVGLVFAAESEPHEPLLTACRTLAARQIQFRCIGTATIPMRTPLNAERLHGVRFLLSLTPAEKFADEDRAVLAQALATRRIRMFRTLAELTESLPTYGLPMVRVEGPPGILAFVRYGQQSGAWTPLIHLVNWPLAGGRRRADRYRWIGVSLPYQWFRGRWKTVRCYQPGLPPRDLPVERHSGFRRLVVPELATWCILEPVRVRAQ